MRETKLYYYYYLRFLKRFDLIGHEGECKGKDNKFYKLGEAIKDEPCVRKVCRGTAAPGSVHIDVER